MKHINSSLEEIWLGIFDVTINLNNTILRILNPEKNYITTSINVIKTQEGKTRDFLNIKLKNNKAAIASIGKKRKKLKKF